MAVNVEIKARASDYIAQLRLAEQVADTAVEVLRQEDTFFDVPRGRLKLREFGDSRGELIQYERADSPGPKESAYILSRTHEPVSLKAALSAALGVRAVVRKTRRLLLTGQTRLHFDEVEGLGNFIELEVVLRDGQSPDEGAAIARGLMETLGISDEHLLTGAYVDMIEQSDSQP